MNWDWEDLAIDLNGLLPVDKPAGWTSHDVVDWIRRQYQIKKVGHTGTLDPIATGVLLLCLGWTTRLSSYLTDQDKQYLAGIELGVSTDTLDAEGEIRSKSDEIPQDIGIIRDALLEFEGDILQIPPMYSAIRVAGKRLYEKARAGQTIKREPRSVRVDHIGVVRFEPPHLDLEIKCTKGTYIRTLADDLGQRLVCGGHIVSLRRTVSGKVGIDQCATLDQLKSGNLDSFLIDPNFALEPMPACTLSDNQARRFTNGNPLTDLIQFPPDGIVSAQSLSGNLLGIGRWIDAEGILKPVRVFPWQN